MKTLQDTDLFLPTATDTEPEPQILYYPADADTFMTLLLQGMFAALFLTAFVLIGLYFGRGL